jgi:ribonuclease BN (tRNA processing enzyme)
MVLSYGRRLRHGNGIWPTAKITGMRMTVLGGCGAWPEAGQACSGFLIEHDGFRLLVDAGYAIVPRLLQLVAADQVDAVYISHGHPDHCADLNPLLRARAMAGDVPAPPLPVYALPGALDAVLALDGPDMMAGLIDLREFEAGAELDIGPFRARTCLLPHWLPNSGLRLTASGPSGAPGQPGPAIAYTGDSGPSPEIARLARDADLLLADATYPGEVPASSLGNLSSAADAGAQAAAAGAGRLVLTHLWPGTDHETARAAAAAAGYGGAIDVAAAGLIMDLG